MMNFNMKVDNLNWLVKLLFVFFLFPFYQNLLLLRYIAFFLFLMKKKL